MRSKVLRFKESISAGSSIGVSSMCGSSGISVTVTWTVTCTCSARCSASSDSMPAAIARACTVVVGDAGYVTGLTSYRRPTRLMVRSFLSAVHSSSSMVNANEDCVMSPR